MNPRNQRNSKDPRNPRNSRTPRNSKNPQEPLGIPGPSGNPETSGNPVTPETPGTQETSGTLYDFSIHWENLKKGNSFLIFGSHIDHCVTLFAFSLKQNLREERKWKMEGNRHISLGDFRAEISYVVRQSIQTRSQRSKSARSSDIYKVCLYRC